MNSNERTEKGTDGSQASTELTADWSPKGKTPFPTIPGYEITKELGHGGMGIVYEAKDTKLKRVVALKIPIQASMAAALERKRFQTEAEAIAQLNHPNIVKIYEIGEHNGCPFICMQLLSGGTLGNRTKSKNRKDSRYFMGILKQIAAGLQHAHERGIIHRDLKPSNVLFDENDIPYIADFGLAKLTYSEKYTNLSAVMGTPSYMSPEQIRGKIDDITTKSDIYSYGAMMYEVLVGKPPLQKDTPFATMKSSNRTRLPFPPESTGKLTGSWKLYA